MSISTVLPDVIVPNLRVLFAGTAAGSASALAGAYYSGPGNAFWRTIHEVGLTPHQLQPSQYKQLLTYGIGLSDVCKVKSGSDHQIGYSGFDVPRFVALVAKYAPAIVAFNSKRAGEVVLGKPAHYGKQPGRLAGTIAFVLPSSSAATRRYWDIAPWQQLAATVGRL
jgi:double-stranded uracil-DNA glycosylase